MVLMLVISIFVSPTYGQNANFHFENTCYSVDDTLSLKAVYKGSGSPVSVEWSYSGDTDNLIIVASTCTPFGQVPTGFPPLNRTTYSCPATDGLPANTFKLKITNLQNAELDGTWGATFIPPVGSSPAPVEMDVPKCCGCKSLNNCDTSKEGCIGSWLGISIAFMMVIAVIVILILHYVIGVRFPWRIHNSKKNRTSPYCTDTGSNTGNTISTPGKPRLPLINEEKHPFKEDKKQTTLEIKEGSAGYKKEKPPAKLKKTG